MLILRRLGLPLLLLIVASGAQAGGLARVQFVVVDAKTRQPIPAARVTVEDATGRHAPQTLVTGVIAGTPTPVFDVRAWTTDTPALGTRPTRITLPLDTCVTLREGVGRWALGVGEKAEGENTGENTTPQLPNYPITQLPNTQHPTPNTQPPIKDIYIKVTATRLQVNKSPTTPTTTIDKTKIERAAGASGNLSNVTRNEVGVAADSAGQQHVRGEHAEIAFVVDGVPLPDTLSGRQGSVVVPSTIQSLEILTGSFAPEFGGQTAAILNIETLPAVKKSQTEFAFEGGSYDTTNGDFTTLGPLGKRASYVLNLGATRSRNALEPQQPDDQTAHNTGSDLSYFAKMRFQPGRRDTVALTLSRNPGTLQLNNRTGLPVSFATLGQGFGFLGLRNADGTRPDATDPTVLGAGVLPIPSQQADGQDITQREVSEFATLSWRRQLSTRDTGLLALTLLHSGQDVHNQNPAVDVLNLPVDNSIEFNPTAIRNVHHVQMTGSLEARRGKHRFKTGFLLDDQNGNESYQLIPGSRLALNGLAALAPNLAPTGAVQTDAQGNPVVDVNGNPVYVPTSGVTPTLSVHRSGFYRAAYVQDTWQASSHFTVNYGLRADWYKQGQNLGQPTISTIQISPRLNFAYTLDKFTALRWSYNRLFNTPPLAQAAILGAPIEPEVLDQYDIGLERQVAPGQTVKMAYYIKQIKNQVDTGLLIPGSQIGLYSAVNFQFGGVHGFEFSYEITPPKGVGFDAYLNYTYSTARPNGVDNTGAPVPDFNDHDQRQTLSFGAAYTWKSGASASLTLNHGSGLASSPITLDGKRVPRTRIDLRFASGDRLFRGHGGLSLDIENLLDDRTVINFQSGFSGTRFQQGRRILLSLSGKF